MVRKSRRSRRPRWSSLTAVQYVLLAVVVVVADAPLAWLVLTAVKPEAEIIAYPPTILPKSLTTVNFSLLFATVPIGTYLINSGVVAFVTMVATVVFGTVAAYSLARFESLVPHLKSLGQLSLVAYMVPPILLVVPISQIFVNLGLANSLGALVVVYTAIHLPFTLWILRSYFLGISVELEEAAMVDGCTRFGAFLRVVLPQAVPGIISAGILTFNGAWQEYLFASVLLIGDPKTWTLSLGQSQLIGPSQPITFGVLMAGSILMTVPVILLFALAQRQLVGGLTQGAVKG